MTFKALPRSSEMSRFEKKHMISCYRPTVTMPLSCIVTYYSQILVENREIYIPHVYSTPP